MTATITPLPNGRRLVTCDTCRSQADTPRAAEAHVWVKNHVCPRRTR